MAKNLQTIMVCRFLVDVWQLFTGSLWRHDDGYLGQCGDSFFQLSHVLGPTLGPIGGRFITDSYLGWRWIAWSTLIMWSFTGLVALCVVPETYSPLLRTLHRPALAEIGKKVVPKDRLVDMMITSILLPVCLFWFGWTSSRHIVWVPQVLAGAPMGMGILIIFMQGLNYVIDVYGISANSAIAANVFIRSVLGGSDVPQPRC
ncbi:uncharacterized protein ATNIH1004_003614 [Aspergillus tanneri]|uniref:Major facilitator superfamily (MFS) profile domain-containing protein n=1 Tax=Aspergillus tanneri TaxID=1220188 RepID=A0A5M9N032_9EURO|nr:uncharacterized protein ATNIH1004_003614 [Aspergillus tanneri]KAA8650924.1 hypothetical protein ATNIH1004_003614 [Aspergillus tanneri]